MAVAARREVVRQLQERGLSERQALRLVGMSASTLRYQPRDDGNGRLRERLTELAGQHRRHGYRMLHSRLRIDGWAINVKRTYRVYREEGLMVRKRRRKKLPMPERQPLVRPLQPDEVWSMDFVFDELANGRRVKTLTVVDDCSKEAVQIAVDTSIPALYVTRVLDQVKAGLRRLLDDFLWGDFGIDPEETEITFSGGRGYHVKVRSEGLLTLSSPERRDLVDYILGTGVDPLEIIDAPSPPADPHRRAKARRIPAPWPDAEAPGWAGRTTRAILAVLSRWEREGTAPVAGELRAMGLPEARAARWAERLVEQGGLDRIRQSRRFDVFKEPFPPDVLRAMVAQAAIEVQGETDAPVTTDIHRLIRLPGSLHGGTGFRVVPLDRDRLPEFDPLAEARAPFGDAPIVRVEYLQRVDYPFPDHPARGSAGSTDELPTAIALFLVLRGEAAPRLRPG